MATLVRSIMNVIQHALLNVLERDSDTVLMEDVLEGVKKEVNKSKRTI